MKTPFAKLASLFEKLEETSSSLKMRELLADFFKEISPQEAKVTAYLLRGEVGPAYSAPEFGLAKKLTMRAIAKGENVELSKVERVYGKLGDLGKVSQELRGQTKRKGGMLTILEVFEELKKITSATGTGSQEQKVSILTDLLAQCSALEARFVVRIVLGTLRLGVAEMTFLYGLAKAFTGSAANKEKIEEAYNVLSDLGEVAYLVASKGLKGVGKTEPITGAPIRMMLAQRVGELEEVKKHIPGQVFVEYKYDGERVEAHIKKGGEIILFSRRHENITGQYPDVAAALKKHFQGRETIVEGEVVAYNPKTGKLLPFQILMRRRRKYEIEKFAKALPVRYHLFDILFLDGKNFLKMPLNERKENLQKAFTQGPTLQFASSLLTDGLEEVEDFFQEAVAKGAEGVLIKDAKGGYKAGKRGWLWIKFKKDYQQELTDTFDLVVVGGLHGTGRRAGTYGSLLVAAFDPKTNKYYSFTKVGAGLTDKDLVLLPKMLNPYKLKAKHRLVETNMTVDVWFEPVKVLEISGADLTISPVHAVAKEKLKKGGLALRFPRFLRWRQDKTAEQATTAQEIYDIYTPARHRKHELAQALRAGRPKRKR